VRRSFAAAALVAIVCTASALAAQTKPPQEEAKEHYQRGVKAYNLERFDEAVSAFSRAYELDPAPILLFNIAQARWKKGESERALFYYRRYLEEEPAAPNRAAVEARIQEIERARQATPPAAVAAAPVTVAPPAPPPVYVQASPPPPAPPFYRRPWVWVAAGATAAAVVATVVLLSRGSPPRCASCNLSPISVP